MTTEQENELICEKLLGLRKHCADSDCPDWRTAEGKRIWGTLSFTTWAEAGLILDALRGKAVVTMHQLRDGVPQRCTIVIGELSAHDEGLRRGSEINLPLSIRAAALEYIRKLP